MAATAREIVLQTLECQSPPRAARQLWMLPWAEERYPDQVTEIRRSFPCDICSAPGFAAEEAPTQGDPHKPGRFVDPWGAVFESIQEGVIGEVKEPLINDWATDVPKVHVPREWLTIAPDRINAWCAQEDR